MQLELNKIIRWQIAVEVYLGKPGRPKLERFSAKEQANYLGVIVYPASADSAGHAEARFLGTDSEFFARTVGNGHLHTEMEFFRDVSKEIELLKKMRKRQFVGAVNR